MRGGGNYKEQIWRRRRRREEEEKEQVRQRGGGAGNLHLDRVGIRPNLLKDLPATARLAIATRQNNFPLSVRAPTRARKETLNKSLRASLAEERKNPIE